MLRRTFIKGLPLASLIALAGCKISPGTALDAGGDLYTAASLTEADVKEIGKQSAAQMDSQNKVASASSSYGKRLAKLSDGLRNEDGLQLNFKVYMTTDVNAIVFPDGSVRVFSALMDMLTDDELFFILGHEIGHAKDGDSLDKMRMAYVTKAARKGAAATGGVAGAIAASDLGAISEAFINAQFSQKQENDADDYGYALLQKYKRNTAAAGSALRKLDQPGNKSIMTMFSTHPEPGRRADRMDAKS